MGKKRIVKKSGGEVDAGRAERSLSRTPKKNLDSGILHVRSTYNNTAATLTDMRGAVVAASSSGALGFSGAKKGTPFAAAKVGEILSEKAQQYGIKEISVVVKGVGSGRESTIRAFTSRGIQLLSIKDMTPVPHNGPRAPKPRRV